MSSQPVDAGLGGGSVDAGLGAEPVRIRLDIDNVGIAVPDLDEACRFFADRLGLTVERDDAGSPPGATVLLGDGSRSLYLFATTGPPGPTRSAGLVGNPTGLDHVSFSTADVDRTYAELTGRGVVFDGPPSTVPEWGLRLASFPGPGGIRLFLVARIAAGTDQER